MPDIPKTLEFTDNRLRLLDQTALPNAVRYVDCTDYRDVVRAIKTLVVRGAPAIGIAGAYAVALAVAEVATLSEGDRADSLLKFLKEIEHARPTAVNLAWAVDRQRKLIERADSSSHTNLYSNLYAVLIKGAEEIHEEDKVMCRKIGEHGSELIAEGSTVLTVCNAGALATGGIGTALGAMHVAHEQGKNFRVYSCETRPLLQGSRLTVWELMQSGIDVTLIIDSVAAVLFQNGTIDLVIVGADRIAANGDTTNKIGTYMLAVLAKAHNVPFYIAAPISTFDRNTPALTADLIEERDPAEVREGFGKLTAPADAKVFSPAFDITPKELISAYITDSGVQEGGR